MTIYPERTSLDGLGNEIFNLVSRDATKEQWAEWLRAPLEHASAQGNLGLVNKLVEAGADGSAGWKGCDGRTLLLAAASGGDEGVMASLLLQGSQPDVNVLSFSSGRSALYMATTCGHEAAARLLILAGADVNFKDPENGHTVLHDAIYGGHERLAKELVMSGANVNARGWHAGAPLHEAAVQGLEGVVSALLLGGAEKDAVDCDGYTALMKAAEHGRLAVVETLLAAGADYNTRCTGDGLGLLCSALDLAARKGHVSIVHALLVLQRGADADACVEGGITALHIAAQHGQEAVIDALIEAGANIEAECSGGETPLDKAATVGRPGSLLALLRHGASVRALDDRQMTPLHSACYTQPVELVSVVDLLLRWDADETALDDGGETPADLLDRVFEDGFCSEDELERVRVLLARAPANRAWRRRGWLVMLRARASIAKKGSSDQQGPTEDGRSIARREGDIDVQGKASNRSGAEGEIERRDLGGAVALLTELQPECIFRLIVGFL